MNIITACGQLGVGKDTLSDYLADKLNTPCKSGCKNTCKPWVRRAFANAVKDIYCESFGVDRNFIEEWKRNSDPPPGMMMNVRQALQMIGDGFRKVKPDIWIDIALRFDGRQIISDLRYINEAKAVKQKNGINILMFREGFLNDDPNKSEAELRPLVEYCINHVSEGVIDLANTKVHPIGLEYFDMFILNNHGKEELYDKIDNLVIPYIKQKRAECAKT